MTKSWLTSGRRARTPCLGQPKPTILFDWMVRHFTSIDSLHTFPNAKLVAESGLISPDDQHAKPRLALTAESTY